MKCPSCPLAARPEGCWGESVARFCTLVASGRCDYAAMLYTRATGEPAPFACPEDVPEPPPVGTPPQAPLVVIHPSAILLYKSCDYRGPVAQCGCTPLRVCWQGKGSRPDADTSYGHVTERDCLACVSGTD